MGDPLDSAIAKFNRANLHAYSHGELAGQGEAYGIDTAVDLDPQATEYVQQVEWELELPWFGAVFGDTIHNFRSCLDHLLAGLTRAHGKPLGGRTQFPIHVVDPSTITDPCYPAEALFRKALKPLSRAERTVIEGLQPYKTGDPDSHPLTRLQRLDNADKHREIAAASLIPKDVVLDVTAIQDCKVVGVRKNVGGNFEFGAELGRVTYSVGGAKPKISVKSRMTPQIILADTGEDVVTLIVDIRRFIVTRLLLPLIPSLFKYQGALFVHRPSWISAGTPCDPF